MKNIFILSFIFICLSSKGYSTTLYEALKQTYNDNTQLNAERENFKASEEDINISKAEYKPSLTLSGSKSIENTNNKISLGTVYNTVHAFKNNGYLKEISLQGNKTFFDTNSTSHHHFYDQD